MSSSTSPQKSSGSVMKKRENSGEDNNNMQDSEMTNPTIDTGSTVSSEEEQGFGWLDGFGSDIMHITKSIKDSVPSAIGNVADFVHRSALTVASEIAKLEVEDENNDGGGGSIVESNSAESVAAEGSSSFSGVLSSLPFPWEIEMREDNYGIVLNKEDINLKQKILALSCNDDTFLQPFCPLKETSPQPVSSENFALDEQRIHLIHRLLKIDGNLAKTHARLSGRSEIRETFFWRNYFYHCDQIRNSHFQEQEKIKKKNPHTPQKQQLHVKKKQGSPYRKQTPSSVSEGGNNIKEDDADSLVPCRDADDASDTSSYVNIASPPRSLNSINLTRSVEDMIWVEKSKKSTKPEE